MNKRPSEGTPKTPRAKKSKTEKEDKFPRIKNITDVEMGKLLGRVFVHRGSYSVRGVQIVGNTKAFVKVRNIPFKSITGLDGSTHEVDWEWIENNPFKKGGSDEKIPLFLDIESGKYYMQKGRGTLTEFFGEAEKGDKFSTVEY